MRMIAFDYAKAMVGRVQKRADAAFRKLDAERATNRRLRKKLRAAQKGRRH